MESKFTKNIRELLDQIDYKSGIVDLIKIAKNLGIRVIDEELPKDVSGVLDCRVSDDPIILINKNHPLNRRRFSLAHEIAHFRLHNMSGVHMDKVFLRSDAPTLGKVKIEREANRYAAELLLPEPELRQAWKELPDDWFYENPIQIIAKIFGVSEAALLIRLQQLKDIVSLF